jgi:hypothetical protein
LRSFREPTDAVLAVGAGSSDIRGTRLRDRGAADRI